MSNKNRSFTKKIKTLDDLGDWDFVSYDRGKYTVVVPRKGRTTYRQDCESLEEAIIVRNDYFIRNNLFADRKTVTTIDKKFVSVVCKFFNRMISSDENEFCRGDHSTATLEKLSTVIDGLVFDFLSVNKKTQSTVPRLKSMLAKMSDRQDGRIPCVLVWIHMDAPWIAWLDANGNTLLSPDLPSVVATLQNQNRRGGF